MKHTAFITGADRGLGLALSTGLLDLGWEVFAGQYMPEWPELDKLENQYPSTLHVIPLDVTSTASVRRAAEMVSVKTGHIDLLINNAGVLSPENPPIREIQDYVEMHRVYNINTLGPLRVVEAFLPLTDKSNLKRLCFVSSEAGSISRTERTALYAYCMSKSALNMGVRIVFNDLNPEGYTFRVYHPGWIRSYMSGEKDLDAILEPEEAAALAIPIFLSQRQDEDRLYMEDHEGSEWPW